MKQKIMIDLDNVITDETGWLSMVNNFLETNYTIEDVDGYFIESLIPDGRLDEYIKYFESQNTYEYCNINDNCKEVLKKLNEKYEIYICSAYVYRYSLLASANMLKQKFLFLTENFPFLNPKNFIFCDKKEVVDCDIKIDDKIENLEGAKTKILYRVYHNKNISDDELIQNGILFASNWKEIERILLEEV